MYEPYKRHGVGERAEPACWREGWCSCPTSTMIDICFHRSRSAMDPRCAILALSFE